MKITIDNSNLYLLPENEEDKRMLTEALGEPYEKEDGANFRELRNAFGKAVYLLDSGEVEIVMKDAWWNYDD